MNIEDVLEKLQITSPPPPEEEIIAFENLIQAPLPSDYRNFLMVCNGGRIGGLVSGGLWFDHDIGIKFMGGIREEPNYSLVHHRQANQGSKKPQIPLDLIWIMTDEFGNKICLGIRGSHIGKVYFWDHEFQPDHNSWDGTIETNDGIYIVTDTFQELIDGLKNEPDPEEL